MATLLISEHFSFREASEYFSFQENECLDIDERKRYQYGLFMHDENETERMFAFHNKDELLNDLVFANSLWHSFKSPAGMHMQRPFLKEHLNEFCGFLVDLSERTFSEDTEIGRSFDFGDRYSLQTIHVWLIGDDEVLIYGEGENEARIVPMPRDYDQIDRSTIRVIFGLNDRVGNGVVDHCSIELHTLILNFRNSVFTEEETNPIKNNEEENTMSEELKKVQSEHFKFIYIDEYDHYNYWMTVDDHSDEIVSSEMNIESENDFGVELGYILNKTHHTKSREFIKTHLLEFCKFLKEIPKTFPTLEAFVSGKPFEVEIRKGLCKSITTWVTMDDVIIHNPGNEEVQLIPLPSSENDKLDQSMICTLFDLSPTDDKDMVEKCSFNLVSHIREQVEEMFLIDNDDIENDPYTPEFEKQVFRKIKELSQPALTKKEDIKMASVMDEAHDTTWLYGFLLQEGFIENESVTDLLYMGRARIRHMIHGGEFDMELDDANRNALASVRDRVVRIKDIVLYSRELEDERRWVLNETIGNHRYPLMTYFGGAFVIELTALFLGILHAEVAETRNKLLMTENGIPKNASIESLFVRFVCGLRENYNLIERSYYTDFTRMLKIIMMAETKDDK